MSKFYNNYLKNTYGENYKDFLPKFQRIENRYKEVTKQNLNQARMICNGKHTGSKPFRQLHYDMMQAIRVVKNFYEVYGRKQ